MPHITIEYSENIENEVNINELLKKANNSLLSHGDLFSAKGIRSRGYKVADYIIGKGTTDDAFVHINLKIAPGRSEEAKKNVFEHLFQVTEKHFGTSLEDKNITISLEFSELSTGGSMYLQK